MVDEEEEEEEEGEEGEEEEEEEEEVGKSELQSRSGSSTLFSRSVRVKQSITTI